MTLEQIKALFPLTVMVTQEIIDTASDIHPNKCIGALTLNSVMPEGITGHWGTTYGHVRYGVDVDDILRLKTEGNISIPMINEPQEVTFILFE